jgi:peptide chain release factor 2
LEARSQAPDFWEQPTQARTILQEAARLKQVVNRYQHVETECRDIADLLELSAEDELEELAQLTRTLEADLDALELATMLCGPDDEKNAILTVHPGAGGSESEDWAGMLLRMFRAFCESQGWKMETLDEQPGELAGIKNASIEISGANVFGYLRSEIGVHRLVRISPFDSQSRRHTSFASVFLYPVVEEEDPEIVIDPSEIRVDTYRASGAGGQHVNKTDSAIRMTHLPSGIVVQCQNERSQSRNRATAMKMLKSRLLAKKRDEEEAKRVVLEGTKLDNAWGSQIRSYVLHPYNMVKDHRTGVETSDTTGVLGGELLRFVRGFLLDPVLNRPRADK